MVTPSIEHCLPPIERLIAYRIGSRCVNGPRRSCATTAVSPLKMVAAVGDFALAAGRARTGWVQVIPAPEPREASPDGAVSGPCRPRLPRTVARYPGW